MLRVNVGLSRKLSKDFNSTGYSINLEGEVTAPVSDPEAVIEQVKELFDLAEETLEQEIDRAGSIDAIASHDQAPQSSQTSGRNGDQRNGSQQNGNRQYENRNNGNQGQNQNQNGQSDAPATNKQIQFLLSLGQQQRMSKHQLQNRVTEILGVERDIYDLTKRDAGMVLDRLANGNAC